MGKVRDRVWGTGDWGEQGQEDCHLFGGKSRLQPWNEESATQDGSYRRVPSQGLTGEGRWG